MVLPPSSQTRIEIVGALRGLAALAVCWFHFTYGQHPLLHRSGAYGWLGVHVFFVISGFIIPYSMYRAGYRLQNYFRFAAKRLARLHPPYVASIVITLVMIYAALWVPTADGYRPEVGFSQLLLHFFYLNDVAGKPWFNVVYWTLAVELQWYLLIGLVFPLLSNRRAWVQVATASLLMGSFYLGMRHERLVFHSVPIFLLGVFVFQYRVGLSGGIRTLLSIAAVLAMMRSPIGLPVACVSAATGMVIASCSFQNRWFNKLGDVSYSLYLLHLPVGLTFIGLASRLPYSGSYLLMIDIAAVGASLAAAYLMYCLVEEPSQRLSSRISLHPASETASEPALSTVAPA
ncbi:MAG TPA: acyltransferase [Terriglobales bacterium]|nr:acyltransferase [Terriglobales bacterium]